MEIRFTNNYNGKLFNENLSTVQLYDAERFCPGSLLDLWYNSRFMGKVKVVATRHFQFRYITDGLSFIDIGQPSHYLAQLLKNQALNEKQILDPHTLITQVVLQYIERNMEMHNYLIKEHWQQLFPHQKSEL